jgi:hypothetical protein
VGEAADSSISMEISTQPRFFKLLRSPKPSAKPQLNIQRLADKNIAEQQNKRQQKLTKTPTHKKQINTPQHNHQ